MSFLCTKFEKKTERWLEQTVLPAKSPKFNFPFRFVPSNKVFWTWNVKTQCDRLDLKNDIPVGQLLYLLTFTVPKQTSRVHWTVCLIFGWWLSDFPFCMKSPVWRIPRIPGEQTSLPHFFKSGFRVWLSADKLCEY